ncbi:hypothetical protein [Vulcanisaeta souniana]|uniref:hypothetical protein n=1 Tax=Vulcanisaeta souniana TaxID=164452 RepID=UPI001FB2F0E9|nr:hypothetical protein [Vulcanisaeta souniana]
MPFHDCTDTVTWAANGDIGTTNVLVDTWPWAFVVAVVDGIAVAVVHVLGDGTSGDTVYV